MISNNSSVIYSYFQNNLLFRFPKYANNHLSILLSLRKTHLVCQNISTHLLFLSNHTLIHPLHLKNNFFPHIRSIQLKEFRFHQKHTYSHLFDVFQQLHLRFDHNTFSYYLLLPILKSHRLFLLLPAHLLLL